MPTSLSVHPLTCLLRAPARGMASRPDLNQPLHPAPRLTFREEVFRTHRLLSESPPAESARSSYGEQGALELLFVTFGALAVPLILVVGLALAVIKRRQSRRTHPGVPPRRTRSCHPRPRSDFSSPCASQPFARAARRPRRRPCVLSSIGRPSPLPCRHCPRALGRATLLHSRALMVLARAGAMSGARAAVTALVTGRRGVRRKAARSVQCA